MHRRGVFCLERGIAAISELLELCKLSFESNSKGLLLVFVKDESVN